MFTARSGAWSVTSSCPLASLTHGSAGSTTVEEGRGRAASFSELLLFSSLESEGTTCTEENPGPLIFQATQKYLVVSFIVDKEKRNLILLYLECAVLILAGLGRPVFHGS